MYNDDVVGASECSSEKGGRRRCGEYIDSVGSADKQWQVGHPMSPP
tara:strand:+ start:2365 stop:2502 length:138 start_codon:yes stop_codon:yes gene_type:complete